MDKKNDKLKKIVPVILLLAVVIAGIFFRDSIFGGSGDNSSLTASDTSSSVTVSESTSKAEESTPVASTTSAPQEESVPAEITTSATTTTSETTVQTTTAEPEVSEPQETAWYEFRYYDTYESHYYKHRDEFTPIYGEITMEQYLEYANDLINDSSDDVLHKTEKEDGDYLFFRKSTEEFLVLSTDGYIRTYFIPTRGIDYFEDQ